MPGAAQNAATQVPAEDTAGRVTFKSERLDGTINLKGARIDDLHLAQYREKIDPKSPEITLLKPVSNENAYFAEFGWYVFFLQ